METKMARPPRRAPTLKDVADHAGVSVMTVSRTISVNGQVKPATRERVERAIAALNYSSAPPRRRASAGAETRIALLYSRPPSSYLSEFLIESLLAARHVHVHLDVETFKDTVPVADIVADLLDERTDGVILLPPLCDSPDMLRALAAAGIPAVAIATGRTSRETSSVTIDDHEAAREMTHHLIKLGHGRIGFMLGDPRHGATRRRLDGYLLALSEAGIAPDNALIAQGTFTYRSGLDAAEKILGLAKPPTAIFSSNDDMAAAAVAVAHRRGLDVPGDLSIAGFDDAPLATTIWPELTTIRQPIGDMSRLALELLVEEIAGGTTSTPPRQIILDYMLVRRQSDSAPRWQFRNG
jgi:LacI family transcriptional regulator